jgi:hypothetical protein
LVWARPFAAISDIAFPRSMVTVSFAAQAANIQLADIAAKALGLHSSIGIQLDGVTKISEMIGPQNKTLAMLIPLVDISEPAVLATRGWQETVRAASVTDVTSRDVAMLTIAGATTARTIQAGFALVETDEKRSLSYRLEPALRSVLVRRAADQAR